MKSIVLIAGNAALTVCFFCQVPHNVVLHAGAASIRICDADRFVHLIIFNFCDTTVEICNLDQVSAGIVAEMSFLTLCISDHDQIIGVIVLISGHISESIPFGNYLVSVVVSVDIFSTHGVCDGFQLSAIVIAHIDSAVVRTCPYYRLVIFIVLIGFPVSKGIFCPDLASFFVILCLMHQLTVHKDAFQLVSACIFDIHLVIQRRSETAHVAVFIVIVITGVSSFIGKRCSLVVIVVGKRFLTICINVLRIAEKIIVFISDPVSVLFGHDDLVLLIQIFVFYNSTVRESLKNGSSFFVVFIFKSGNSFGIHDFCKISVAVIEIAAFSSLGITHRRKTSLITVDIQTSARLIFYFFQASGFVVIKGYVISVLIYNFSKKSFRIAQGNPGTLRSFFFLQNSVCVKMPGHAFMIGYTVTVFRFLKFCQGSFFRCVIFSFPEKLKLGSVIPDHGNLVRCSL